MAAPKSTPKDAQVMSAILKDMGIVDYEPRVINQMLEFTYRYVTNILEDARLFSNHAKKRAVDVDDVRLAIQMQAEKTFTSPPPRDLLMEIARQKNSTPLPLIKANAGPRLPPDRYSLTACNYRLKSAKKPRIQVGLPPQLGLTMQANSAAGGKLKGLSKVTPALSLNSKTGATLAVVSKSASAPTVTIVSRPATTNKTHPTPIIKLSQRPPLNVSTTVSSAAPTPIVQVTAAPQPAPPAPTTAATVPATTEAVTTAPVITTATTEPATQPSVPLPIINIKSETPSEINDKKRKREDDDDYDATE
ncbi:transcription initiation factor TFIID subunit 9B isoform X2 [Dermacentor silvarum]|uniref:transcription initiation factor TFIID subunit 9B isoform X2 n=1 Tax=Dermacentor silvarum TaxID=543639 RepID=UPI002101B2D8|nr:transcription initiation factor TFIID subunit 9B isoform X2 [Dermacentor silvarum]